MAVAVDFYTFQKSPISTKLVDVTTGVTRYCNFKKDVSLTAPVLELDISVEDEAWNANYCRIDDFGRFYFIRDWEFVTNRLWRVYLEEDVLATYRAQILASTQFVERAEKAWDSTLGDRLCLGVGKYSSSAIETAVPWANSGVGTVYIVEILGGTGTSVYYQFSPSQFSTFLRTLFSDAYADSIVPGWKDIAPELKANLNPLQYLGAVRTFPIAPPGMPVSSMYVGWGLVEAPGQLMTTLNDEWHLSYEFPSHPNSGQFAFANYSPYSEYGLYLPLFGDAPIDPAAARKGVDVDVSISIKSGGAKAIIKESGTERVVGTMNTDIASPVGVSNSYAVAYGARNLIDSSIQAFTAGLSWDFKGIYEAFSGTVDRAVESNTPKLRASGTNGDIIDAQETALAYARFQHFKAPASHFVGRPYYKSVVLQELFGGLVQCVNADVPTNGMREEAAKVEKLLEGGVYLE